MVTFRTAVGAAWLGLVLGSMTEEHCPGWDLSVSGQLIAVALVLRRRCVFFNKKEDEVVVFHGMLLGG